MVSKCEDYFTIRQLHNNPIISAEISVLTKGRSEVGRSPSPCPLSAICVLSTYTPIIAQDWQVVKGWPTIMGIIGGINVQALDSRLGICYTLIVGEMGR